MNLAEMLKIANEASEGIETGATKEFEPIPAGEYTVAVVDADGPKNSSRANPQNPDEFGQLLQIQLSVVDGPHANRRLFLRNNIIVYPKSMAQDDINSARTAMAIGCREREIIMASKGISSLSDPKELVGASFKVKVAVKPYNGKMSNEITRVLPLGSSIYKPQQKAPAVTQAQQPKPATPSVRKMPWEK